MPVSLPDELISEILSPALKVPEKLFSNLSPISPFAKYSVSTSSILLVCKAWLRVATPLLYDVVILRSKAQAKALGDALKLNPKDVSDAIWLRIVRFAHLAPMPKVNNSSDPSAQLRSDRKTLAQRAAFLLVCKTFHRLGAPYLYRYIKCPPRAIRLLAKAVDANPRLAHHICTIKVNASWDDGPFDELTTILEHASGLERVILPVDKGMYLPWPALRLLSQHSGSTLKELTCRVKAPSSGDRPDPLALESFTALVRFAWAEVGDHGAQMSYFLPSKIASVSKSSLPALCFLILRSTDLCPALIGLDLPRLDRLSIRAPSFGASYMNTNDAQLLDFLRVHGAKLLTLATDAKTPAVKGESLLSLCPSLTWLECRLGYTNDWDFELQAKGFRHAHLARLDVRLAPSVPKPEKIWAAIFASESFQDGLKQLPALIDLRIGECVWPTNEYEISKSAYVKTAEQLAARTPAIKMKDKKGREWHPRLKTARAMAQAQARAAALDDE
ncbi:F-box domain-containing protein [Mycena chlorophos]|uniref:F-box domain-containing protein n=1 Tax=Mycena chlorophos TaxID=658473 RepID=A0A8H6WI93_MYCCL|nr:F-box domain-containing protein [Mycena chlorophos]